MSNTLEHLDFDAFVRKCDESRSFDRLQVVAVPQWGVNRPLANGALRVTELELEGQGLDAAVAWLRTWGRAVFDRVELLRIGLEGALGLDLVTNHPATSMKEVVSRDWRATREANGWHFELSLVGNSIMAPHQAVGLSGLMRSRLSPIASRFTIRMPELPGHEPELIRHAAGHVPLELQPEGSLAEIVAAWDDAPF